MSNGKSGFPDMDVGKMFAGMNFPGFDVQSLMATQRKNMEAFAHVNQLAVASIQAFAKRQVEITTEAFEQASTAVRELTQPGAPEEKLAKNAELAKHAFEKSLAATRELADLVAKANADAFEVLNKRVTESFGELSTYTKKAA